MKHISILIKKIIYRIWEKIDIPLIYFFSMNAFLASIYYVFFSKRFYLEHKAVLLSRVKYYKNLKSIDENSVLIRRNIHRLEKGIIMKPRRSVFATNYILETVNSYATAVKSNIQKNIDNSETIIWAHDVLKEYFEIIDDSDFTINKAKNKFLSIPDIETKFKSKPYLRKFSPALSISYDNLNQLAKRRRSVRWYKDENVEREKIDKAVEVAGLSPSACNRQPYHFLIFDDKEKIKSIASIPMGTKGFHHNFPGFIAVIGDLSSYFNERDRHVIYIDASLAAMSFIYALETLGISSSIINWPDIYNSELKIAQELHLKPHERVVMFISYGYADPEGMIPFSQKKSINHLRIFD